MEWVETTGRTVEEAKDAALDQLGVDEQDAEFDIVEEPRTGLFGRLRNEARVRARVRPTKPRPKEDRRDRRRERGSSGGGTASSGSTSGSGGDRGGDRPAKPGGRAQAPRRERPERPERSETRPTNEGEAVLPTLTLAEQAEVAKTFLEGLMDTLGAQASVTTADVDADTVEVNVEGEQLGMLIGPKGQTLAALQELTRTVVQRRTGGREGWLLVDVSGYRKKRREALERFARDIAQKVIEANAPMAMEPMSPADRKIVHDTINEIDGVATTSEGEDARRHVVVRPA